MAFNPIVDEEKCVGCEECVDVCPVEVFEMEDGKSKPVNAEECLGCESCVEVCEEGRNYGGRKLIDCPLRFPPAHAGGICIYDCNLSLLF